MGPNFVDICGRWGLGAADRRRGRDGSNHLLLEDLLDAHGCLLRALVVLAREPVAAGVAHDRIRGDHRPAGRTGDLDRKSTRLNSSHITISYAVFCLKKQTPTQS